MGGEAIGAQAIGDAGLRRLASEREGPRPGGTPAGTAAGERRETRAAQEQAARATRP